MDLFFRFRGPVIGLAAVLIVVILVMTWVVRTNNLFIVLDVRVIVVGVLIGPILVISSTAVMMGLCWAFFELGI